MWIKNYHWKPLFYRWVIICSEDLKYFSMFTQSRSWGLYPTALLPLSAFSWVLDPSDPTPSPTTWKGLTLSQCHRFTLTWQGMCYPPGSGLQPYCQPLLIFSRCRESRGIPMARNWGVLSCEKSQKALFEFLTLTSVQRCWSDYHLFGLRAGQLMTRVLLDLDLGEPERASVGPLWKTPSARALVSEKLWSFNRDWIEICLFWLWRKCLWS